MTDPRRSRRRMLRALAAPTLLAAACSPPSPAGIQWSDRPLSALQATSRMQTRPLLVLICPSGAERSRCDPVLEEASRPEAGRWAAGVLALRLRADQPEAGRLMRVYGVSSLPALLLLGPGGERLAMRAGVDGLGPLRGITKEGPTPLADAARDRLQRLEAARSAAVENLESAPDADTVLTLSERAIENGETDRAGTLLSRLEPAQLSARQLVTAGDQAERAGSYELAVSFWGRLLREHPDIKARAEALGRWTRAMVRAGRAEAVEAYVFQQSALKNQWEYLTVATALLGEGRPELARRIASRGLAEYPRGPDTEALRSLTEEAPSGG